MIELGGRPVRQFARGVTLGVLVALATGCQTGRPRVDAALRASPPPAAPAAAYTVACPDRLDVAIAFVPEWTDAYDVGPDGCVRLPDLGPLRVAGLTPAEVAAKVAAAGHVPPAAVRVRVADYRSRQVFLFGQVEGAERAVPYQGPETVVDLLRRAGGLPPGAEARAVHVVRPHVAAGRRPEVFTVDLEAVLLRGDRTTDVALRPYDQVYVGETRRYSVLKFLPEWLHVRENSRPPAAGGI
jgi:protein involved in polysaccharide export with SLBB domain